MTATFTRKDVLGWWLADASSEAGVLDEPAQLSQLSGVSIPAARLHRKDTVPCRLAGLYGNSTPLSGLS